MAWHTADKVVYAGLGAAMLAIGGWLGFGAGLIALVLSDIVIARRR